MEGTSYELAVVNGGSTVTFIYVVPCGGPVTLTFHILHVVDEQHGWWERSYAYAC